MARDAEALIGRAALARTGQVALDAAEDLLASSALVTDRATQQALEDFVDHLADALRMLAGHAGYVTASWPAPIGGFEAPAGDRWRERSR